MLNKVPFKFALTIMLILVCLVVVFHCLVLTQVIPYHIVWGGKLQNVTQMRRLEIISILINVLLLSVVSIKGKLLKLNMPVSVINIILWLFVMLFSLNTIGNLFAKARIETIVFTPLTFISAILCYRIVTEKVK